MSGGLGFIGTLTLIFVVLKLTNVIAWSWLWVLSPVWISFLLVVFLMLVVAIFAALVGTSRR